jgi:hypothetical protein
VGLSKTAQSLYVRPEVNECEGSCEKKGAQDVS